MFKTSMLPRVLHMDYCVFTAHRCGVRWALVEELHLSQSNDERGDAAQRAVDGVCVDRSKRIDTMLIKHSSTNLYMGTLRYRRAVTPDMTYSHQKKASGST